MRSQGRLRAAFFRDVKSPFYPMTTIPYPNTLRTVQVFMEKKAIMTDSVRVVIADDSARSRDGLRALLTTTRAPLVTGGVPSESATMIIEVVGEAANGLEAVQAVAEVHPDVVLMDVLMPVLDGLEATRRIKAQWPGCWVIALTLHPAYRQAALAAGADLFLVKGGPTEELLRAILASRT